MENPRQYDGRRALRLRSVKERTGLSQATIYRLIQQTRFPAPHKLSERISVWDAADVDAWLAARFGKGGAK